MAVLDPAMAQEARITEIVNSIATKFNCKVKIDYDNHTIDFDGDRKIESLLAMELSKYFECF